MSGVTVLADNPVSTGRPLVRVYLVVGVWVGSDAITTLSRGKQ